MSAINPDKYLATIAVGMLGLLTVGILTDQPLVLPVCIVIGAVIYAVIYHLRWCLNAVMFMTPLSMELELSGGIGLDFPGEIGLIGLSIATITMIVTYGTPKKFMNRISYCLLLQLLWVAVVSILAEHQLISFKYLFAKVWYILPFYVLPFYLVRTDRQLHQLLDWFIVGVMIGGVYFFARHLMNGFDFAGRVNIGQPLWRNHVNYACTLVCSLPIVWYRERTTTSSPWVYRLLAICLLVFIHLAYARVAYLCIGAALLVYWVIRLRLVIPSLIGIIASLLTLWSVAIKDLQYVAFAPEYERAITQNDFGSKLVATFNKQDISSMERVHRWVAGMHMSADRPIVGFGPANFYSSYRPYTIHSFETYVSDNPERSGIHCYYLMILVEQGWPGLLLFVIIGVIALLRCQSLYHHASDPSYRQLVLMVAMILVMILTLNLINDMIEVIKIGSLYFFCFFLLYYQAAASTQEEKLICS